MAVSCFVLQYTNQRLSAETMQKGHYFTCNGGLVWFEYALIILKG